MKPPPGNRDVKFVDALLDDLKKTYKIDDKQVYAMGHSNGGRFSYLLWAERSDAFRAFSMCGSNSVGFDNLLKPKSAFLIAGANDSTVPFANQEKTAGFLKNLLKVEATLDRSTGGFKSYKGASDIQLATYFHPGGHEYPADAGKMVAEFFRHLPSNTDRAPYNDAEAAALGFPSAKGMVDEILDRDSLDDTKWELTQRVPMRFNRLLLLRPWLWHTAGENFGDSLENGRLVYLMFFASAQR